MYAPCAPGSEKNYIQSFLIVMSMLITELCQVMRMSAFPCQISVVCCSNVCAWLPVSPPPRRINLLVVMTTCLYCCCLLRARITETRRCANRRLSCIVLDHLWILTLPWRRPQDAIMPLGGIMAFYEENVCVCFCVQKGEG